LRCFLYKLFAVHYYSFLNGVISTMDCWIFTRMCFFTVCPVGTFGVGCQELCECVGGETCNHATGKCNCGEGRKGFHCEEGKDRKQYEYSTTNASNVSGLLKTSWCSKSQCYPIFVVSRKTAHRAHDINCFNVEIW
jgi:hypothetical protein